MLQQHNIHQHRHITDPEEALEHLRLAGRLTNRGGHYFNHGQMPYAWSITHATMEVLVVRGVAKAVMSCRGGAIYVVAYIPTGKLMRKIEMNPVANDIVKP